MHHVLADLGAVQPLQEYAHEMEELMSWMRDADEDNDNELDPLLALADQAVTQATPAAAPQTVAYWINQPFVLQVHGIWPCPMTFSLVKVNQSRA